MHTLGQQSTKQKNAPMMNVDPKESILKKEVQRLNKELEYAKLKLLGLETMIQEAEKHLQIKIQKKYGTKQSKG